MFNILLAAAAYNLGMMPPLPDERPMPQEPPPKVSDAVSSAPSLSSIWQACHAESFFNRLGAIFDKLKSENPVMEEKEFLESNPGETEEEWKQKYLDYSVDYNAQIYSAALHTMLEENPSVLNGLSNADLAQLADLTALSSGALVDMDQIKTVHNLYDIAKDPGFAEWDARKKLELVRALSADPVIAELIELDGKSIGDQTSLSRHDRFLLAERITEIQSSIYGYPKPAIDAQDLSSRNAWGIFDPDIGNTGTIFIDQAFIGENKPLDFIKTVLHENDHAFQAMISSRVQLIRNEEWAWEEKMSRQINILDSDTMTAYYNHMSGWMVENLAGGAGNNLNAHLLVGGKMRQAALSMMGNERQYIENTKSEEGYNTNPREKHSVYAERVADFLVGGPKERLDILKDFVSKIKNGIEEGRVYRNGLHSVQPDAPCPVASTPENAIYIRPMPI